MILRVNKLRVTIISVITLIAAISNATQAQTVEANTDRPGWNYRNFPISRGGYQVCQSACRGDAKCRAWTFVKPTSQRRTARCWLKSSVPPAGRNNCCTSGIKAIRAASWHSAGYRKLKPTGGTYTQRWRDNTYDTWQNRGTRIVRTKTKRHRNGRLETIKWVVDLENMPGNLVVGQTATVRLKGSVVGYILPAGGSSEFMDGNIRCIRGCQIVKSRGGRPMAGFLLNDRERQFDLYLEIRPTSRIPANGRLPIIEIELSSRATNTVWTYRPG